MARFDHADARILVVDDEEQNLSLISAMLAAADYRHVTTVNQSSKAIEAFEGIEPDLILLDLHMPPPDGFAVMHAVREQVPADDFLPILVLSADASHEAKQRALANGATDFVAKPLQLAEVLLRIRNLLDTRHVHQELKSSHASMTAELEHRQRAESAQLERRRHLIDKVENVLATGGPLMVYQPIIELPQGPIDDAPRLPLGDGDVLAPTSTTVGLEALARFLDPPPQPPDRWFEEAAEVDLGFVLELAAIDAAVRAVDNLPAGIFLSINASGGTICSAAFDGLIDKVPPGKLVVELTEHERIDDYQRLTGAVQNLHDRGVRIAVDDAGAGFSSLEHILRLGPDIVKLDRKLITQVDRDPIRRSMIAALVHFAAETGIILIAEGIENTEELDTLRRLGVRHGQGYHLALPADLPTALLQG